MGMRFDFSDEAIHEAREAFLRAMAAVRDESTKLYHDLMAVCRTQNTLMAPAMERICGCHNDLLYELIRKRFQDWTESEASLSAFARACGQGDDSFFAAYNLESIMLDYIDEQFCGVPELPAADCANACFFQAGSATADVLRDYVCRVEERQQEQTAFFSAQAKENTAYEVVGKFVFEVFEIHRRTLPALIRLIAKVETRIEEALGRELESACTNAQASAESACAASFVID